MSFAQFCACILIAVGLLFQSVSAAVDVVTEWNEKANAAVLEAKVLPFAGTRVMAIVHAAMFDAINSIEGHYTPYKFKVFAAAGSSPEAAGVAAAHATLVVLFPEQKAALDTAYGWTAIAKPPAGCLPVVERSSLFVAALGSRELNPSTYRICVPSGFRRATNRPRPSTSTSGTA
jgi:hypothetical protein